MRMTIELIIVLIMLVAAIGTSLGSGLMLDILIWSVLLLLAYGIGESIYLEIREPYLWGKRDRD